MIVFQESFIFVKYLRRGRQCLCDNEIIVIFFIYVVLHPSKITNAIWTDLRVVIHVGSVYARTIMVEANVSNVCSIYFFKTAYNLMRIDFKLLIFLDIFFPRSCRFFVFRDLHIFESQFEDYLILLGYSRFQTFTF